MKKIVSILFVWLILVAGMNLTISTHVCGGEIAAVKWSFSGEKASCGMENPMTSCPVHGEINSACCQDKMAVCTVDGNYYPTIPQIKKVTARILQIFMVPSKLSSQTLPHILSSFKIRCPRDKPLTSAVSLETICVFII